MSIGVLKDVVKLCHNAKVPMFLWGHHGIGKSSLVQQVTNELDIGFVDYRAAQIEATDLRGYPKEVDGKTVYCPPIELPQEASRSEGRK